MKAASRLALVLALGGAAPVAAGPVNSDGSVKMPELTLPFSTFASPEARAEFAKLAIPKPPKPPEKTIEDGRAAVVYSLQPFVTKMRALYAVAIEQRSYGGVPTEVFTPTTMTSANRKRVLINLHGGGFSSGAGIGGRVESIPIAAVAGIVVVSVDYRQGPEHRFPAASEDVATVYRALLKTYRPENIGIYGSSAGGVLTAEAVAWIAKERLPRPGAVAILCAGASGWAGGDSHWLSFPAMGEKGWGDGPKLAVSNVDYFEKADVRDPLVAPVWTPSVIAKFPATLLITATRDFAMSAAVHTHGVLDRAGVPADLAVWDGLPHYFYANPDLPESREVYERVARFFHHRLGKQST